MYHQGREAASKVASHAKNVPKKVVAPNGNISNTHTSLID